MEDVAGYRLLRSAGHGDRARLLLGFDEGRTVVLKVTAADDPSATVEIEALERAAGEHVVTLVDVSVDENETVLVLERLPNGTLADLLERRDGLDAGEVVTILAPIAAAIDRIHAVGVAHGTLSLATICFREDGSPTLVGFGQAHLFAAGGPEVILERMPGVLSDREALRGIAALVLARVTGSGAAAARALAIAAEAPREFAARLFDVASATPVRFDADEGNVVVTRPERPREPDPGDEMPRGALPPWLTTLIPDGVSERLDESVARLTAVWSGWGPRRRKLTLGALAGGAAVLVAVAAVPAPTGGATADAAGPTAVSPAADEPAMPLDPIAAVALLWDERERCLRDLSLLCLDKVVQADSAAQAEDMALIRGVQAGAEYPVAGIVEGEPVIVERLGDVVLIDLPPGSRPASLLLILVADGWRIRDYLDAPFEMPGGDSAVAG